MKAIQVTIDEVMLGYIDRQPETKAEGRSAFIRRAVAAYLRERRQQEIDGAYRKGYARGVRDSGLGPWEDEQVWPEE